MLDPLFEYIQVFFSQLITIPIENALGFIYVVLNQLLLLSGL